MHCRIRTNIGAKPAVIADPMVSVGERTLMS